MVILKPAERAPSRLSGFAAAVTLSACLLAIVPTALAGEPAPISPARLGVMFCALQLEGDSATLESLLTPTLAAAIARAESVSAAAAAVAPDEKPPLGDGIPWASYPDRPDSCRVSNIAETGTSAEVTLRYGFAASPEADFADTLRAAQVETAGVQGWLIDDVVYADGATLSKALSKIVQQ